MSGGKKPTKEKAARTPNTVSFPCATFQQAETQLVLFSASGKQLWQICQINQREEDKDEGYQRALSPARANRIATFIDEGNFLPTSVVIAFDEATLEAGGSRLRVPYKPDAGWVIDGQHRLAGAHRATSDIELPVVAFIGLALDDQINCFVTINREQKGVPSSLYLDLLKHLPPRQSEAEITKERASDLGQSMKVDESSPFFGRIVTTTSPKHGQISLTNFVRKVSPLIKRDGPLFPYRDEQRRGVIENYYRGLAQVFPREYRRQDTIFFKTLGFGALMGLLPFFFHVTIQRTKGDFRVSDAAKTFRLIEHFDFGSWHTRGTGSQAENAATEDLRQELQDHLDSPEGAIRL